MVLQELDKVYGGEPVFIFLSVKVAIINRIWCLLSDMNEFIE